MYPCSSPTITSNINPHSACGARDLLKTAGFDLQSKSLESKESRGRLG